MMTCRGAFAAVAAVTVAWVWTATAVAAPPGYQYEQATIASDGATLHADVWRPQSGEQRPVLLLVTPYGPGYSQPLGLNTGPSSGSAPVEPANPHGYGWGAYQQNWVSVRVDLRGYGGSTGCIDFGGSGDQADVKAAVEWAAAQPWSNGRVALVGSSYDGWTGVMGLATKPRGLVAITASRPVVTPYDIVFDGGIPMHTGHLFAAYAAESPLVGNPTTPAWGARYAGRATQTGCNAAVVAATRDPDRNARFWRERDLRDRAATSDVPILSAQGFLDPIVEPGQITGVWARVNGQQLTLAQVGHEGAQSDPEYDIRFDRFLEEHLDGKRPAVRDPDVVVQEAPSLRWRAEHRWPPADAVERRTTLLPGSYQDVRGNFSGDDYAVGHGVGFPPAKVPFSAAAQARSGIGSWTFTAPLEREAHIAGFGEVQVEASGPKDAWLVALLYDVDEDGNALLIGRGASLLGGGKLRVPLSPQDWRVEAGHRIGVLLSGSDDSWYTPLPGTGATVTVAGGTLTLPVLAAPRDRFREGAPGARFHDVKHPIRVSPDTIARRTVR